MHINLLIKSSIINECKFIKRFMVNVVDEIVIANYDEGRKQIFYILFVSWEGLMRGHSLELNGSFTIKKKSQGKG